MSSATQPIGQSGVDGPMIVLSSPRDQSGNLSAFNFGSGTTAVEIALGGGYFEVTDIAAIPKTAYAVTGALALSTLLVAQRRRLSCQVLLKILGKYLSKPHTLELTP